jgi:hypothetical protein
MITSTDQTQYIWFSKANNLYFNGTQIDVNDVVQFVGGSVGLVYASQRTIATSIKLEEARYRNSSSAIPAGVLRSASGIGKFVTRRVGRFGSQFQSGKND